MRSMVGAAGIPRLQAGEDVNGEPPYVGWKGLGLALREALDERDRLRADWEAARADCRAVLAATGVESIADVPDLVNGLRQEIEILRAMVGEVRPQGGDR